MKMLSVAAASIAGVLVLEGLLGYAYFRNHAFTARQKPSMIESTLATTVRNIATPQRESDARVNRKV